MGHMGLQGPKWAIWSYRGQSGPYGATGAKVGHMGLQEPKWAIWGYRGQSGPYGATGAKVGHMGLQCDKLQRDDLGHYRQPLQERRRGHGKTGNVPTIHRFKEEKAHTS